jgi:hypothetical protein
MILMSALSAIHLEIALAISHMLSRHIATCVFYLQVLLCCHNVPGCALTTSALRILLEI